MYKYTWDLWIWDHIMDTMHMSVQSSVGVMAVQNLYSSLNMSAIADLKQLIL